MLSFSILNIYKYKIANDELPSSITLHYRKNAVKQIDRINHKQFCTSGAHKVRQEYIDVELKSYQVETRIKE